MHRQSNDTLNELALVDGRYIEWQWDPQTFKDTFITMREANGRQAVRTNESGREINVIVSRNAIDELVSEACILEDQSKRASGLRTYRLTEGGRKLRALQS